MLGWRPLKVYSAACREGITTLLLLNKYTANENSRNAPTERAQRLADANDAWLRGAYHQRCLERTPELLRNNHFRLWWELHTNPIPECIAMAVSVFGDTEKALQGLSIRNHAFG